VTPHDERETTASEVARQPPAASRMLKRWMYSRRYDPISSAMNRDIPGRPVWSSDPSFVPPCEACGEPPDRCRCKAAAAAAPPATGQVAKMRLEKKGRGGKAVTVIAGVQGGPEYLKNLARELKEACGTGGALKDREIELQGDQRERAARALAAKGFRVKGLPG
jgi:translation initiation factor 1